MDEDIRSDTQLNGQTMRNKTPLQLLRSLMTLVNDFGVDPSKKDEGTRAMITEAF
jgi:hypothetical protein